MDAEYTIDECVQLLASYLTNPWQRQRAPKGFDEALTTARSESTSTARVFLDAGFHAWLAYFLATEHEGRHHKGQSAKRKAITALQQFPIERQNQVAMALANVDAHPTVQSAIEDLRHPKRRRKSSTYPPLLRPLISTNRTYRRNDERDEHDIDADCVASNGRYTRTRDAHHH